MIAPFHCSSVTSGPACSQRGGRGNHLVGGDASGNQQFGISVEKRTSKSTIIGITATMNTQGDLMDGTPNCDDNLWFGNTFTVASPSSCIH